MKKRRNMQRGGKRASTNSGYKTRNRDEEKEYSNRDVRNRENDISWYSRNPNLLIAAGSFPYPYRPGSSVPFGTLNVGSSETQMSLKIPGFLAIDWVPSFGISNLATDPASIAAKEIYAKVRKVYSGSLEADAPDFMIYLGALDSIYVYIGWLKRIYRTISTWTPDNYAMPDALLAAQGLTMPDILSLRSQKTQMWQIINELVLQSRKFTCPAIMDYFNRHYWMSDNVYCDAASIQSQMYLFNPSAVYQYAELPLADGSGNNGPGLKLVNLPWYARVSSASPALTAQSLYDFGRSLIDALVAWDEAYTINGYLSRAYDGVPNFVVEELPQDAVLVPVYVEEVLTQIENTKVIPGWVMGLSGFTNFNIVQNPLTNAIVSNPQYTGREWGAVTDTISIGFGTLRPMLSIRSDSPTVADSVVASRLQAAVTEISRDTSKKTITYSIEAGTEIPLNLRYYDSVGGNSTIARYNEAFDQDLLIYENLQLPNQGGNSVIAGWSDLYKALNIEQFDWHPFFYVWRVSTIGTSTTPTTIDMRLMGDTHNLTTISRIDLENLHKVCLYSEFNAFSA